MVRCASEANGLANTVRALGHEAHLQIWTDAAAARGLALRSGSLQMPCAANKSSFLTHLEVLIMKSISLEQLC